jgi:hypothetical protein
MAGGIGNFGALVGPQGVWLLEYAAEAGGLRVVERWSDTAAYTSADEAFSALRRLVDARDVSRANLAVTINGFGALHHTVLLPSASPDVLEPLIRREVMRNFDLPEPVIRFSAGDAVERRSEARGTGESGLRMVFVAAIPGDTAAALQRHLSGAGVRVQCVTIVAEALRYVYAALGASREATAVLVCLASGPYLAFFLHGHPEIVMDPPIDLEGEQAVDLDMLRDQVERGAVYFRQRFGGAEAERLLVAPPAGDDGQLAALLHEAMGIPVEPLMGDSGPEAVVAMGAVFASRAPGSVDLFPRAPTAAQRLRILSRSYGAITLALGAAAILAALWLGVQLISLERGLSARNALQKSMNAAIAGAAPVRSMAQERATHEEQVSSLRAIYGGRARLAGTLASVARIATGGVRFDSVLVDQGKKGWSVSITGAVLGEPGSYAVRTLNEFYAALSALPAVSVPDLERFDYARPLANGAPASDGPSVALTFVVSFQIDNASPEDE